MQMFCKVFFFLFLANVVSTMAVHAEKFIEAVVENAIVL